MSPDGRAGTHSTALVILAIIAAGAALYFARELFVPVALALLFTAVLRPVVRALAGVKIPAPAGATIVVLGVLALIGTGGFLLSLPLQDWAREAPKTLAAARTKLEKLRRPVQRATEAVAKLQQEVVGQGGRAQESLPAPPVSPQAPVFLSNVFGTTASLLGGFLETIVLVFLLLATGDLFTRRLATVMPRPAKGTAPFMIAFLTITAFATFQAVGQVLLVPASYLAITTIQNNAVSPFAYGSCLRLNPVMVLFVTLVGWFLWGVAGAFVAVPVLAAVKVFADHSSRQSRLAAVLGE